MDILKTLLPEYVGTIILKELVKLSSPTATADKCFKATLYLPCEQNEWKTILESIGTLVQLKV